MKSIDEKVRSLPPELQREVEDFVQFLTERNRPGSAGARPHNKMRMTWAGGLNEFREKFSSLELQKKALEWWGD